MGIATQAEIVFEFDYSTSAEFNDPNDGPIRRQALEDAAWLLGSQFNNDATLQISVTTENNPESDTLASAASNSSEIPEDFFGFYPSVVESKVLQGVDSNGEEPDGVVTINFGIDWDLDDEVGEDLFDFKATMIHELLHALGFSSSISPDGVDIFETPPGEPGVWGKFDQFVSDSEQNFVIDENYVLDPEIWNEISLGGSSPDGGIFFAGPRTLEANNNDPVGLYSPTEWSEGSSGSHLDDDNQVLAGMLMLAATNEGQYTRSLSDIERAILADLGYDVVEGGKDPDPVDPDPVDPDPVDPDPVDPDPVDPDPVDPDNGGDEIAVELAISVNSGVASIAIYGAPGDYQVEATIDFETWEPIGLVTIPEGSDVVTFEEELFDLQFYRITAE
jgi:hypothetical protein